MNILVALLQKELREAVRDRRALMAAMTMAVLAPAVIYIASQKSIEQFVERPDIFLAIDGTEHAPELISYLASENILALEAAPEDKAELWRERDIRLSIPSTYTSDMQKGRPVELILTADFTEQALQAPLRRTEAAISAYGSSIGAQRILMRGIDLRIMNPIDLERRDTAPPANNTGFLTIMLVMYLMMAAFLSSLPVAVDASAGERERQVLELLLCQPVNTGQVVLAKLTVASLVSIVGVFLTLVLSAFAISRIDLGQIGLSFSMDIATGLQLLAVLVPVCIFAAALQLFVAFFSRSFKEAQSTVSLVMLLPALMPMAISFITERPDWLNWLPLSGQYLLLESLFKGSGAGLEENLAVTGSTLLISLLLCTVLAHRLRSEKSIMALS